MKKIGLVTYHKSYNYGAVLQVYATQYLINKLGYDCQVINYVNSNEEKENKLFALKKNISIVGLLKNLIRNFVFKSYFIRKSNFERFINRIEKTKEVYSTKEVCLLGFDTYLVGSDQVWNPQITGGEFDKVFLLDFPVDKKISYASSMGSYVLKEEDKALLKEKLSKFNAISVREEFANEQLKNISIESQIVCDPTLLINKEEWLKCCSDDSILKSIPQEYIFLYILEPYTDELADKIKSIKEEYGLPVVYVAFSSLKKKNIDYRMDNVTPERFISLINNASLVVTDSFHGTAFSVNFNKPFISILNPVNPKRVENFLKLLNLENRIYKNTIEQIDYKEVNTKLEKIRDNSIKFLEDNL